MIVNNSLGLSDEFYYEIISSFIEIDSRFEKDIINMISKADVSSDDKLLRIKALCEDSSEYLKGVILNDLGLFAKMGDDLWSFKYDWIHELLQKKAEDVLWDEGVDGVGRLLMCQYTSERTIDRIFDDGNDSKFAIFDELIRQGIASKESIAVLNVAYCVLAIQATSRHFESKQFERIDLLKWVNCEQMIFIKSSHRFGLSSFFHTILLPEQQWVMDEVFSFCYVYMQYALHIYSDLDLSWFDGRLDAVFGSYPLDNVTVPACFKRYGEFFVLVCIEVYGLQQKQNFMGVYVLIDKFKRNDRNVSLMVFNNALRDLSRLIRVCEMKCISFESLMGFCWHIWSSMNNFPYDCFLFSGNRFEGFYYYEGALVEFKEIIWLGFKDEFIGVKFLKYFKDNPRACELLSGDIVRLMLDYVFYGENDVSSFDVDIKLIKLMSNDYILNIVENAPNLFEGSFARDVYKIFCQRMPDKAMLRLRGRFFGKVDDLNKQDVLELSWFKFFADEAQMIFVLDVFEQLMSDKVIFERLNEQNTLMLMLSNIVQQRRANWERAVEIVLRYYGKI
ncbi:MAG: hypothetical protein JHC54_15500 [Acinetobacter sp.]|nr:hypothetical protein [Acinetobacter sp.]